MMDKVLSIFKSVASVGLSIMDEALSSMGNFVSSICLEFVRLVEEFSASLLPGWSTWEKAFNGDAYGHGYSVGSLSYDSIFDATKIIGASTTLVFLVLGIMLYFFKANHGSKESPFSAVARAIIAAVLILSTQPVTDSINEVYSNIYPHVIGAVDSNNATDPFSPLPGVMMNAVSNQSGINIGGVTFFESTAREDGSFPPISHWFAPLVLILFWPIIKEYIRLILEMFERYLVMCILLFFFPIAAATIVLEETSNIFVSYLRMIFGQFTLFLVSTVLLGLGSNLFLRTVNNMMGDGLEAFVFMYIFTLGFMRMGQKVDGYMNAMGFNVAHTGIELGNALVGAGLGMLAAARTIGKADHALRTGGGKALQAVGAKTNSAGLFKAGALLEPGHPGKLSSNALARDFAREAEKHGNAANVSNKAAKNILESAMTSQNRGNVDTAKSLSQQSLVGAVDSMVNGDASINGNIAGISDVKVGRDGDITFHGFDTDGNEHTYKLTADSSDPLGKELSMVDSDGNVIGSGVTMNTENTLSDGEFITGSASQVLAATGALGVDGDVEASISKAERVGKDTLYYDDDDNVVGRVTQANTEHGMQSTYLSSDRNFASRDDDIARDIQSGYHPDEIMRGSNGRYVQTDESSSQNYVNVKRDGNLERIQVNDVGSQGRVRGDNITNIKSSRPYREGGRTYMRSYGVMTERQKASEPGKPPRSSYSAPSQPRQTSSAAPRAPKAPKAGFSQTIAPTAPKRTTASSKPKPSGSVKLNKEK